MSSPAAGRKIQIHSYKHNGMLHRIWESNLVMKSTETTVLLVNDKTKVIEADGRTWMTSEPGICYFHSRFWFNVIGMVQTDGVYYYCNMGTPFVYDADVLQYIDYDLDVKVYPNMTFDILDKDEYEKHKAEMEYPYDIDQILHHNLDELLGWIRHRQGPFAPDFINRWYEKYLTCHYGHD